ncbi:MAG: hypothetical protein ACRBBQ_17660 [Cognatishimia sp.]
MNRIITTSAAALVLLTGAASAGSFASAYEDTVKKFAPDADLSAYSEAAIGHIVGEINSNDDDSFVQKQAQVRSLLNNLK